VIAWRDVPGGADATVRVGACTVAYLHARQQTWEVELPDGRLRGAAGSLGHAKRASLEALAEVLSKAAFEVDVALRSA